MRKIVLLILMIVSTGCANVDRISSYGHQHEIKQYSGGVLINRWISDGRVISESESDGYFFTTVDGNYIEVSGTLVIEKKEK